MRITLKAARVNKGMTQIEVANAMNVSRETVGRWEKGVTRPKWKQIEPLCALFGVKYDDITWNVN